MGKFLKKILFILSSLIMCSFFQSSVYAETGFDMSEISVDDLSNHLLSQLKSLTKK